MFYEVFIPSNETEGFDVTITVEADNWMTALKSGLERTGEGADAIRNVMCDIKDDNTIHVTDATTRRVFILQELGEEGEESGPEEVEEGHETLRMEAPAFEEEEAETEQEADEEDEADQADDHFTGERVETKRGHQTVTADQPARKEEPAPSRQQEPPTEQPEPAEPLQQQEEPPTEQPEPAEPLQQQEEPPTEQPEPAASRQPAEASAPTPESKPEPEQREPAEPVIEEPEEPEPAEGGGLEESSWTSDDGRMRIGSSTHEALQKDEEKPKVVREKRVPTGQRGAVEIGRGNERVSENILEEVFLEIQRIHDGEMSMEEVVNYVMDLAMEKVHAEAGSILFADVNGKELYFATARGPKAEEVMDFRVPMGVGIVGFCAREGVSLAISDVENDPRFYRAISEAIGYDTQSLCCAPVQYEGRVYGAIELMNKDNHNFSSTEANVLTYVGRQLAKFVHDLIMAREEL